MFHATLEVKLSLALISQTFTECMCVIKIQKAMSMLAEAQFKLLGFCRFQIICYIFFCPVCVLNIDILTVGNVLPF